MRNIKFAISVNFNYVREGAIKLGNPKWLPTNTIGFSMLIYQLVNYEFGVTAKFYKQIHVNIQVSFYF
jgi:hypothetical protein